MFLKLIPDDTKIPFTKLRFAAIGLSLLLIAGAIGALFAVGLNFGVDFKGGVTIEVADDAPIELQKVRDALGAAGLDSYEVSEIQDFADSAPAVLVRIAQQQGAAGDAEGGEAAELAQQNALQTAKEAITALLGDDAEFRKEDVVGPTVSGELVKKGAMAVAFAIGLMLIYIWLRFEWQFSVGAILALVHDVIITLGVFAATRLEFNLSIIAAILTIVGYSMNDTVVVYDRVRENLRKYKTKPLAELLDLSINETLSRTVMTSFTTLLALAALAVFGGEVLRGFTLAMIWGIVIGTYSSIFVASPLLLATGVKRDWSRQPVTAAP